MENKAPNLIPKAPVEFTSRLSRGEAWAVGIYLPLHLIVLPTLFGFLLLQQRIGESSANMGIYLVGFVYMLFFTRRFLRRDFDALCDRPWQIIAEIVGSYGVMLCCNMMFSLLAGALVAGENPNNQSVAALAVENYGPVAAMAIYMAPVVEELLFRAGIFGVLRRYNRIAAYVVSVLGFSLYHVLGYALQDPIYWIYVLQYIPVSYLLCRCYESSNCIWSSIFFHMLVNGISIKVLSMAQQLL